MLKDHSIVSIGEILVEFISHHRNCGLEKVTEYSGPYPSGAPAIFADQAAKVGGDSTMIGGVGADGFGQSTLQRLEKDHVDTSQITVNTNFSTGVAFVSYYDDGSRTFIYHIAGTAADSFDDFDLSRLTSPVVLHISAASLGSAIHRPKILLAVEAVKKAGGKISCDPNARPELMRDPEARKALHFVVDSSDILMPSTSDLKDLYPDRSEDEAIEHLLSGHQSKIVALKRGEYGATVAGFGEHHEYQPHRVEEVDPTGAGDCFCGTFISLLSQGFSLYEAGRYANAAGAMAVMLRGPMEGNSSTLQIETFLNLNLNDDKEQQATSND